MNILVTGNRGYIGAVLTEMLLGLGYNVTGYDTDYYAGSEICALHQPIKQKKKDIRDVSTEDLDGIDAIIHLAALSNDPLGQLDPYLTEEINFKGTMKLANYAKKAGIKRFVYASSQSMYGISNTDEELDEDKSTKNPLTAYARTKWDAECELKNLNSSDFTVVCMRPSTVFGPSPRFRCDIVFNNLVACAYTTGKIEIKSDGTPWRPVIHVRDASQAFIAGLRAPQHLISGESFNIGIKNGNFTIRQLAEAAQQVVPGSTLVFTGEHGTDARTYKISFKKIFNVLGEYFYPECDLDKGGKELIEFFKKNNFSEQQFRGKACNRLKQMEYLLREKKIDKNLNWLNGSR
ncbi:MAG: NAD(P)-dependent oxidoreductase [Candidatus Omnitrophica bacterium]|nr:NAD(P)-dependent oxidoreductase [Candidatus Omnitrophota bacterium]MDD5353338.1 NAD(P)-dependent oxidoreductase [Candidatus Omnitrophota bacterium]MDD5591876.1 NAD(P)-dependent oxidoreductase [Candidatus Omnitrophota bacterium]